MHCEMCVCVCVSVFSGQADKQFAHILCRILMARLTSPTDDIHRILCAWSVCIYVCPLQRVQSYPCELWSMHRCVCVCMTDPSLSLSAPPNQRGVVLMTLPSQRSSWTSAGWDFVPFWQKGWHGWLTRQRYTYIHVHVEELFLTDCTVIQLPSQSSVLFRLMRLVALPQIQSSKKWSKSLLQLNLNWHLHRQILALWLMVNG